MTTELDYTMTFQWKEGKAVFSVRRNTGPEAGRVVEHSIKPSDLPARIAHEQKMLTRYYRTSGEAQASWRPRDPKVIKQYCHFLDVYREAYKKAFHLN